MRDDSGAPQYVEDALRRLQRALLRPASEPCEEERRREALDRGLVGASALSNAARAVDMLSVCDEQDLAGDGFDPDLRRRLRFLAVFVDLAEPGERGREEIARRVHETVANPRLPLELVREIMAGSGRETPADRLRHCASLLVDGLRTRRAADEAGVDHKVAEQLAVWIALPEAREHAMRVEAQRAAEDGATNEQFAERVGVSPRTASTYMRDARRRLREAAPA